MAKIGRNKPCPCGSGKKFKHCHGRFDAGPAPVGVPWDEVERALAKHEAQERIREQQQGRGRPIIATRFKDHQVVAVRNRLFWSKNWKTFPDFLGQYICHVLGTDWGNAEIARPLVERHPIMQWYDEYCRYQAATISNPGHVTSAEVTGIVACYLGLAYSLYLIDHNVELQKRLIHRLKDPANFQGAYYELIVANVLIRAGFTLSLEDEVDPRSKHCEFRAVSGATGKRYTVEAKMHCVEGFLGKTPLDGSKDGKPLKKLVQHVHKSLAKPSDDERLIFVDLNAEPDDGLPVKPSWIEPAARRLERLERENLPDGVKAYVFVTNMAYHRRLHSRVTVATMPFGLGMPEFGRPGEVALDDAYRTKRKHIDAYKIGESIIDYARFPSTFDGSLPSEAFGGGPSSRVVIGETYHFDDVEGGLVGTVTTATVSEPEKMAYIGVTGPDGKGRILTQPMSGAELQDYRAHPDAYFGRIVHPTRKVKNPFEMFEFLMETYSKTSRERLIEFLRPHINKEVLAAMSHEELAMTYCQGIVASMTWKDDRAA